MKKSWDRGVDYRAAFKVLAKKVKSGEDLYTKCYCSVLLIQLRNGLRISEAVRAFKQFLALRKREVYVKLSKKKTVVERLVVIPKVLLKTDLSDCTKIFLEDDDKLINRICVWTYTHIEVNNKKVNTHSLRYAFITHLLKKGVSPSIIAKITGHSKLDYILTYTQTKAAEEVLKNM